MGVLSTYLQRAFCDRCPEAWTCRREVPVLPPQLQDLLGYAPHADVLLESTDGSRRLWIEFEVSRADPVANHAKFATSHLFHPMRPGSAFVSMVSPHVNRGRRNLAAATVHLMRHVGIESYQTMLLPGHAPEEVQRLNHLDPQAVAAAGLAVDQEIERAFAVSQSVFEVGEVRVHLAGELLDVLMNLRRWNEDVSTDSGRKAWGRRTVTYFIFDAVSGDFAPSKFCGYLPVVTVCHGADPSFDSIRGREITLPCTHGSRRPPRSSTDAWRGRT